MTKRLDLGLILLLNKSSFASTGCPGRRGKAGEGVRILVSEDWRRHLEAVALRSVSKREAEQ